MAVAHRIYATALFEAAKGRNALPQVREELADFVAALDASTELRNLLLNPQVDARAKRAGLLAAFAGTSDVFRNFLLVCAEKGRLAGVEEIQRDFERLVAREERVIRVELTTATELSDAEASEILAQIENVSGRRVEATRSVDPGLIGGMVLQAGSLRVDASVRGRLNKLREELVSR
jgi:F-type H+-transporting ATPase subunit delta